MHKEKNGTDRSRGSLECWRARLHRYPWALAGLQTSLSVTLLRWRKKKGDHASTEDFKVAVFELLESTGLGYDTRFRHYRQEYPDTNRVDFARMTCDPIEGYDKDWPDYRCVPWRVDKR